MMRVATQAATPKERFTLCAMTEHQVWLGRRCCAVPSLRQQHRRDCDETPSRHLSFPKGGSVIIDISDSFMVVKECLHLNKSSRSLPLQGGPDGWFHWLCRPYDFNTARIDVPLHTNAEHGDRD